MENTKKLEDNTNEIKTDLELTTKIEFLESSLELYITICSEKDDIILSLNKEIDRLKLIIKEMGGNYA